MRGTPPAITVDVGDDPRVVTAGTTCTSMRLGNALVTMHGTIAQRQLLVLELARELGLQISLPGAEQLLEEMQR